LVYFLCKIKLSLHKKFAMLTNLEDRFNTNSLSEMHDVAWHIMQLGKQSHKSNMHQIYIATVDAFGNPQNRTVILRSVDADAKTISFHTDCRSSKVQDLMHNPNTAALLYDHENRVQVRLQCIAALHQNNAIANDCWQKARLQSQLTYGNETASSTLIPIPTLLNVNEVNVTEAHIQFCKENFMVVTLQIHALDILFLHHTGNKRMQTLYKNNETKMSWVEP
jgi:pyridoxamine 5'-phosphate oxidase